MNQSIGNRGEQLAASYLKGLGYSLIERNLRIGKTEIDLLCRDDSQLVIVEVKSRLDNQFFDWTTLVENAQIKRLSELGSILMDLEYHCTDFRMDIIAIRRLHNSIALHHLRDLSPISY